MALGDEVAEEATRIIKAVGIKAVGLNPRGVAATAIHAACKKLGVRVTEKDICAAAKVSDATLRNVRKRLFSNLSFQLFEPAPQTPDGCAPSSVQGEPMT